MVVFLTVVEMSTRKRASVYDLSHTEKALPKAMGHLTKFARMTCVLNTLHHNYLHPIGHYPTSNPDGVNY